MSSLSWLCLEQTGLLSASGLPDGESLNLASRPRQAQEGQEKASQGRAGLPVGSFFPKGRGSAVTAPGTLAYQNSPVCPDSRGGDPTSIEGNLFS